MSSRPAPPTPAAPLTNSSSPALDATTPDPIDRLDALLEIYLDRLDAYQRLRDQLSQNFSAGFLSLAHANRTSNLGSGRRYGEEGYDERMKAGRRVKVLEDGAEAAGEALQEDTGRHPGTKSRVEKTFLAVEQYRPPDPESEAVADSSVPAEKTKLQTLNSGPINTTSTSPPPSKLASSATESTAIPAAAALTESGQNSGSAISADHPNFKPPRPKPTKKLLNPLNWYGVLVPQSLRAAQTSFTSALENQIAQLVNVQAEMAELETQIRQLRRRTRRSETEGITAQQVDDHHESSNGGTTAREPSVINNNTEGAQEETQPSHKMVDPQTTTSTTTRTTDESPTAEKQQTSLLSTNKITGSGRRKSLPSSSRPREAPRSKVLKVDT